MKPRPGRQGVFDGIANGFAPLSDRTPETFWDHDSPAPKIGLDAPVPANNVLLWLTLTNLLITSTMLALTVLKGIKR